MPCRSSSRFSLRAVALLALALAIGPAAAAPPGSAGYSGRGMILVSEYPIRTAQAITSTGQAAQLQTSAFSSTFMRWPTTGRITQPYGCTGFWANQSLGSCRHFHTGIDIANARWTPIRAAAAGKIRFVGREPYGAWMVVIGHGDGLRSRYAHLVPTRVAGVAKGRAVRKGQLIGYMGKSGLATGVHLHFEVKRNGSFVNPGRYLPAWGS